MRRPWTKAHVIQLRTKAAAGDAGAQRELATILASGSLGAPNHERPPSGTERPQGGDVNAQYNTGLMHLLGEGVRKSRLVRLQWLKVAAQGGSDSAAASDEAAIFSAVPGNWPSRLWLLERSCQSRAAQRPVNITRPGLPRRHSAHSRFAARSHARRGPAHALLCRARARGKPWQGGPVTRRSSKRFDDADE